MLQTPLSYGRIIHEIVIFKKKYLVWELTLGWLLTLLHDPAMFGREYFREFNKKFPSINKEYSEMIFGILLGDIEERKKQAKGKAKDDADDIYISIAMLVKHLGFSYSDIMSLPVRVFYILIDNNEVIAGTKDLEEHKLDKKGEMDSPEQIRNILREIKS